MWRFSGRLAIAHFVILDMRSTRLARLRVKYARRASTLRLIEYLVCLVHQVSMLSRQGQTLVQNALRASFKIVVICRRATIVVMAVTQDPGPQTALFARRTRIQILIPLVHVLLA